MVRTGRRGGGAWCALSGGAGAAFAAGWDIYYYMEPSGRRVSVGSRFCAQVHVSMWLSLGAAVAVSLAEWAAAAAAGARTRTLMMTPSAGMGAIPSTSSRSFFFLLRNQEL